MKSIHALRLLGLAAFGALIASPALAQESGYYYGGLSLGQSRARIDDQRISAALLAEGLRTTAMARDERDTAYKLFGGYQLNRNLAIEAGFFDLGRFGFTSTTVPAGTLNGQIRLQGLNLDLLGSVPLTAQWSALGRFGAQYARARDSFSGAGAVAVLNPSPSKRETNLKLGLGLQYELSPSLLLRGEVERYRVNDAVGNHGGVNVFSISLVVPFSRAPAAAPRAMAAPDNVAPAAFPAQARATVMAPERPLMVAAAMRADCAGSGPAAQGIACLQPDRRVELQGAQSR